MADEPKPADYPDPMTSDLEDPLFQAVWERIKGWDMQRVPRAGYAGPTGNDVMHILVAVRPLLNVETARADAAEATSEDRHQIIERQAQRIAELEEQIRQAAIEERNRDAEWRKRIAKLEALVRYARGSLLPWAADGGSSEDHEWAEKARKALSDD